MLDCNALKAEIVRNGYTQKEICQKIGMSEGTFIRKMRNNKFGTDEAGKLVKLLGIKNPAEIFFAEKVTS